MDEKADNPAVSLLETRGFPAPPRGGCGLINFPALLYPKSIIMAKNLRLKKLPEKSLCFFIAQTLSDVKTFFKENKLLK